MANKKKLVAKSVPSKIVKPNVALEAQEIAAFQESLKLKLRYLGSFASIALIILGLFLLINGLYGIITKKSDTMATDNQESILQDIESTPEPFVEIINESDGAIINGVKTERVKAETLSSEEKSQINQAEISNTHHWRATDYQQGDIGIGDYQVKLGDTLWEISEAVYGNGNLWGQLLSENKDIIGFLSDGSQALIFPGQILRIAK